MNCTDKDVLLVLFIITFALLLERIELNSRLTWLDDDDERNF